MTILNETTFKRVFWICSSTDHCWCRPIQAKADKQDPYKIFFLLWYKTQSCDNRSSLLSSQPVALSGSQQHLADSAEENASYCRSCILLLLYISHALIRLHPRHPNKCHCTLSFTHTHAVSLSLSHTHIHKLIHRHIRQTY